MKNHLSDDRLIEVCVDAAPDAGEREHLEGCAACDARRREVARLLAECTVAADVEAEAVFTDERLARQHARILQRVEQDGRPGRVIAFPAGQHLPERLDGVPYGGSHRTHAAPRWIAAAAAAGLVIGLLAGQMVQGLRGHVVAPSAQAARPAPAPALRAVATSLSEEDLLLRVDSVVDRSGGSALGPLDELTPRVWEVAAR